MVSEDDLEAVRRGLAGATLSVACLSLRTDVPAERLLRVMRRLEHDGIVTRTAGPCQICGGVAPVYSFAAPPASH